MSDHQARDELPEDIEWFTERPSWLGSGGPHINDLTVEEMTVGSSLPFPPPPHSHRQARERSVPCGICGVQTWSLDGLCMDDGSDGDLGVYAELEDRP